MLKITRLIQAGQIWLTLEGKLMGPWVSECRTLCALEDPCRTPTMLDLSGVSYVDPEGEALLRHLACRGFQMARCSSFVAELLEGFHSR